MLQDFGTMSSRIPLGWLLIAVLIVCAKSTISDATTSPTTAPTQAPTPAPRIKSDMVVTLQAADGKFASSGGGGTRFDANHAGHWEHFHVFGLDRLHTSGRRGGAFKSNASKDHGEDNDPFVLKAGCNSTTCLPMDNRMLQTKALRVIYPEHAPNKIGLQLAGNFISNKHGRVSNKALEMGLHEEFTWACVENCPSDAVVLERPLRSHTCAAAKQAAQIFLKNSSACNPATW